MKVGFSALRFTGSVDGVEQLASMLEAGDGRFVVGDNHVTLSLLHRLNCLDQQVFIAVSQKEKRELLHMTLQNMATLTWSPGTAAETAL